MCLGRIFACACLCILVLAASAQAAKYTVDSTGDQVDAAPGTGGCETALGTCTLRAAIEDANLVKGGSVYFDPELFDGEAVDTIALDSPLPAITEELKVDGDFYGVCETAAGVPGPCARVDGPAGETAFTVSRTLSGISALAITGAGTGIEVAEGAQNVGAIDNWFGVALDGSAAPNTVGLLLGPNSREASVFGNHFAYNTDAGLDVESANRGSLLRNRFGVLPQDGTELAPNGNDIEVGTLPGSGEGSVRVGQQEGSGGSGTPECDSGCNVIAGDVDLTASDPGEEPGSIQIKGAYIGLDATGTVALPHAGPRIVVGEGAFARVGGIAEGEGNYIVGGSHAVLGSASAQLVVERNFIGYSWDAAEVLESSSAGAVVFTAEPGEPSAVVRNRIALESGPGVDVTGRARIERNVVDGGDYGIRLSGASAESRINLNVLKGQTANGILLAGDGTQLRGNAVLGAGAAGIRIEGGVGSTLGSEAPADANTISGSGGDAIEILGPQETATEIARNRGTGNAGLYIDLGGDGAGNEPAGPNDGIQAPIFTTTTAVGATGTARPGATIRIFEQETVDIGELGELIGTGVADETGNWSVDYETTLMGEGVVAATQTDAERTSELAISEVEPDFDPPQTTITEAPPFLSESPNAEFEFGADEPATFECSFDLAPFAPCEGQAIYEGVKKGPHLFRVRATDLAGNVDPTPAVSLFIRIK